MLWIEIGNKIKVHDKFGNESRRRDYTLYIWCSCRIVDKEEESQIRIKKYSYLHKEYKKCVG